MSSKSTILVFGGSGRTGRHFVEIALKKGHKVRALVRDPAKLAIRNSNLELRQGSIVNGANLDELLQGVESVVCMLGDAKMQSKENVNTAFVKKLIPAMRRRSEEHTSELQSLMRISYAVFCLKKKKNKT